MYMKNTIFRFPEISVIAQGIYGKQEIETFATEIGFCCVRTASPLVPSWCVWISEPTHDSLPPNCFQIKWLSWAKQKSREPKKHQSLFAQESCVCGDHSTRNRWEYYGWRKENHLHNSLVCPNFLIFHLYLHLLFVLMSPEIQPSVMFRVMDAIMPSLPQFRQDWGSQKGTTLMRQLPLRVSWSRTAMGSFS